MYNQFRLQPGIRQARAKQVADHFRLRIETGDLAFGESLPPADSLMDASRMTVLRAYRQLQDEGLVRLQPSRGTVVIARKRRGSYAIVVSSDALAHGGRLNLNMLIASLITQSPADRQAPRMYVLRSPEEPTDNCEAYLPDQLREDISDGVICGVFLWRPLHLRGVSRWLEDHNLPVVSMGADHMDLDFASVVGTLLDHYRTQGVTRVEVWDTSSDHRLGDQVTVRQSLEGMQVDWLTCGIDHLTAISTGQGFARRLLERNPRPEALIVTDDWVGLTAVQELMASGVTIPEELRVGVFCSYGFLPQVLYRCDRFVTDPDDQAKALHQVMEKRLARESYDIQSIPLRLQFSQTQPEDLL